MFRIDWQTDAGALAAIEPTPDEVRIRATELAVAYNEPKNAELMGHTASFSADDVIDHYADMAEDGARQFLLLIDGALAGDADLRGLDGGAAEFAFMIGAPAAQGKGLGTRFALMVHVFAFDTLGLATVYASVAPQNVASRRVFEKLGYAVDASPAARAYADEPEDVVLSIDRATFQRANAAAVQAIRIAPRAPA